MEKNKKIKEITHVFGLLMAFSIMGLIVTGCEKKVNANLEEKAGTDNNSVKNSGSEDELIKKNLAKFDTLDFKVFSKRDWKRFHESHADNVIVHFPDGHVTNGLKKHIEDMEAMFVYAPDTRITAHPIKVGQGNITAVTGVMEGTFTQPMPDGKGGFIKPTGKKFKIPMATFSIWKEDGTMSEEFLYWDNQTYMKQLGL